MAGPLDVLEAAQSEARKLLDVAELCRKLAPINDLGPESYSCPFADQHRYAVESVAHGIRGHARGLENAAGELMRQVYRFLESV